MRLSVRRTKAVILPAYNNNLIRALIGMKTGERDIPALNAGQVLIKMAAAPCNPSDIAFIRGGYNITRHVPAVPGFEGAGVVVDTGGNAKNMLGKRVSSFVQAEVDGTWAEYFIADANDCIVLKDELDFDQGACLSINPFTAYGLIELAGKNNCKAIVQNAAGGQVAEFIRVLADIKGIAVINIVRKQEHIAMLKDKGADYVLDSTNDNFETDYTKLVDFLRPAMAFDAVGGEMTGFLMTSLPSCSRLILYGGLSGSRLDGLDPVDIIFKGKKLQGFNLNEWIAGKTREEFRAVAGDIQDLIINGKMKTEIQGCFKLDDVVTGIRSYIKSMSSGKILFKP